MTMVIGDKKIIMSRCKSVYAKSKEICLGPLVYNKLIVDASYINVLKFFKFNTYPHDKVTSL